MQRVSFWGLKSENRGIDSAQRVERSFVIDPQDVNARFWETDLISCAKVIGTGADGTRGEDWFRLVARVER